MKGEMQKVCSTGMFAVRCATSLHRQHPWCSIYFLTVHNNWNTIRLTESTIQDISALFTRRYKDRNASLERELDALVNPRKESVPTNPVAQAPLEVSMSLEAPEHQLGKTDGKMNVIAAEQLALTEGDVGVLFESDRKSALTASAAWEALVLPNAPNHSLGESNHNVDAADHETANENRRAARDEAR